MDKLFSWVRAHIKEGPAELRLRMAGKAAPEGVDVDLAILQVECRRKCAKKLKETLAAFPDFFFPTALSAEQCTSDRLASFHASLMPEWARTGVDLTAGLGIDAMALGRRGLEMTAIERMPELAVALRYNSAGLGIENLTVLVADCREWLARVAEDARERVPRYDVAFIDPARRGEAGERLFALGACSPDVVAMLPEMRRVFRFLIIKASPMLDVSHTIAELSGVAVREVIATGTTTECKELLVLIDLTVDASEAPEPVIRSATLLRDGGMSEYSYTMSAERQAEAPAPGPGVAPGMYIYEPYPAMMKCGAGRLPAIEFGLWVFDANTRLYYSRELRHDFPGEAFEVLDVQDYASRNIKRFAKKYPKISVSARNFGITAEELRRKLGVRDGDGRLRVFGLTSTGGTRLLVVGQIVNENSD